jgi:hypothetical protein
MQYIILVSLYFYSLLNFSLSGFFFDSLKTFGIAFKHIFIPLSQNFYLSLENKGTLPFKIKGIDKKILGYIGTLPFFTSLTKPVTYTTTTSAQ